MYKKSQFIHFNQELFKLKNKFGDFRMSPDPIKGNFSSVEQGFSPQFVVKNSLGKRVKTGFFLHLILSDHPDGTKWVLATVLICESEQITQPTASSKVLIAGVTRLQLHMCWVGQGPGVKLIRTLLATKETFSSLSSNKADFQLLPPSFFEISRTEIHDGFDKKKQKLLVTKQNLIISS